MPQINGIKALREIRKTNPKTNVIMITAYVSEENIRSAKTLGAHGFILKPSDVLELRNYADRVLSQKVDSE